MLGWEVNMEVKGKEGRTQNYSTSEFPNSGHALASMALINRTMSEKELVEGLVELNTKSHHLTR